MRWVPASTIVLVLLAGCTGPDAPSSLAGSDAGAGGVPPEAEGAGASSSPEGRPTSSPTGAGTSSASAYDPEAVPTEPVVGSCDVAMAGGPAMSWAFGYAFGSIVPEAQDVLFPTGCSAGELAPVSGGSFRSVVVEFSWENDAPMADVELALRVGDLVIVVQSASSPIRVELTDGDLPDGPVAFDMKYGGTGMYLDFRGTTWFSAFETESPPEGYTAIP